MAASITLCAGSDVTTAHAAGQRVHLPVGTRHGQRHAREAGSGAHVQHPGRGLAVRVRLQHGQQRQGVL